jgi:hypothetical protein
MKKSEIALALGICALLFGRGAADDKRPESRHVEPGFTPLFNGKDLSGWHVMNQGRFSVKDGVIFQNRGTGWLRTDREYKDFELRLDFRFLNKEADSGIFIRAGLEGSNWPARNYQVQTMDNHTICNVSPKMLAKPRLKKDEAKLKKVMKPTGEWQSYVVTAQGPHLEIRLNGELITVADGLSDQTGYIGLQGEYGMLEFKHIRVKELKPGKE